MLQNSLTSRRQNKVCKEGVTNTQNTRPQKSKALAPKSEGHPGPGSGARLPSPTAPAPHLFALRGAPGVRPDALVKGSHLPDTSLCLGLSHPPDTGSREKSRSPCGAAGPRALWTRPPFPSSSSGPGGTHKPQGSGQPQRVLSPARELLGQVSRHL